MKLSSLADRDNVSSYREISDTVRAKDSAKWLSRCLVRGSGNRVARAEIAVRERRLVLHFAFVFRARISHSRRDKNAEMVILASTGDIGAFTTAPGKRPCA